jgi:signal peptidase I
MSVSKPEEKHEDSIGETIMVIIQALLLALVVRTFAFQPFNIPSGSMKETLLVGDYLFVSKFSYGYSQYSFPFGIAPFKGRIWGADPQRGDIVVFRLPTDTSVDYIKRVIGLPGDRLQVRAGVVYINGQPVKREPAPDFVASNVCPPGMGKPAFGDYATKAFKETLPNGVSYRVLQCVDNPAVPMSDGLGAGFDHNNTKEYVVPPGHFFMMGDNRDNSQDSRFINQVGYVPAENLVGKAQMIFFSVDTPENASWGQSFLMAITEPSRLRLSRLFNWTR